jgi:hypothetical protein
MRVPFLVPITALAVAAAACGGDQPAAVTGTPATTPRLIVSGAGFTTVNEAVDAVGGITLADLCQNGNPTINCNIYGAKSYVWLNGGPATAYVGPGTYMFAVLEPGGQGGNQNPNDCTPKNLSDDPATCVSTNTGAGDDWTHRVFSVDAGGNVTYPVNPPYAGGHQLSGNKIRLMPYDDTQNPGGVYILAICSLAGRDASAANQPGVDPSACKYDAFKVRAAPVDTDPTIAGGKYYDTNLDGQWSPGEVGIPGWLVDVTSGGVATGFSPITTGAGGLFGPLSVPAGTYHLAERQPLPFTIGSGPATGYWSQTGNTVDQTTSVLNTTLLASKQYDVTAVLNGSTDGLYFGNVCYVRPGGRTIGFWSNKNGLSLITSGDFTALNAFNLRNADGSDRDFPGTLTANKTAFNAWLLSANASNMAYMLSAQMSGTYLDVQHGFTDGTVVVDGTMTINQLIAYANSLLANPIAGGTFAGQNGGLTVASGALRTEQERVKNIFDKINNNGGLGDFLQSGPAGCPISFGA